MAKELKDLTKRSEDYSRWYNELVVKADLAEQSAVRGCMVIKPYGYAIWEKMQRYLDDMFKQTDVTNAYFPLLIPKSFLSKEADHVEGFAKECAVVTHYRLKNAPDGTGVVVDPEARLEEELIIRPTSETIIWNTFRNWIHSYRDLPVLVNQWCNVFRWEMRTRMFLRTAEFLWQEGHTAHATKEEAIEETNKMLRVYEDFAQNYMAMPVICGRKTEGEKFPGAVTTYCIEAMMQDRKALQAGTSHFLGQNFAKASNIRYLSENGSQEYAWTTSWGVSTRLIGGLVMTHSDDNGLVLPPRIAPTQIVILPIIRDESTKAEVMQYCQNLQKELSSACYDGKPLRVELDARDMRGGEKAWSWVKKGVPIRLEIGPRDIANNSLFMARRDDGSKQAVSRAEFAAKVPEILAQIQNNLFAKALKYRQDNTVKIDSKKDFYDFFTPQNEKKPEIHGGFAMAHFDGSAEVEDMLRQDLKVTVRCIPLESDGEEGVCPFSGRPSKQRVVFAKSY